jgi:hypothetical protein
LLRGREVHAMLEGRTVDCLAIANTAILMRLIDELIGRGVLPRPAATAVLGGAVSSLQSCPNADHSNFEEAIRIIRTELIPAIAEPVPPH